MCKHRGYTVVGIVGNPNKNEFVKGLGADLVISKQELDWVSESRKFSPKGFDIILDANGHTTLMNSFKLLKPKGKLISYGFHTMLPKKGGKLKWPKLIYSYYKTPKFNPVHMTSKNKSLVTFNLSFIFDHKEILQDGMAHVIDWIEKGYILPPKVTVYDFDNVAQAHKDIESGDTMGKLILNNL
jgi:NADPH:quinone reductase-like Zn-dependent oxidoreductase